MGVHTESFVEDVLALITPDSAGCGVRRISYASGWFVLLTPRRVDYVTRVTEISRGYVITFGHLGPPKTALAAVGFMHGWTPEDARRDLERTIAEARRRFYRRNRNRSRRLDRVRVMRAAGHRSVRLDTPTPAV